MTNPDLIAVAVFAFVLVSVLVGGLRAFRIIEQHKAEVEAERLARLKSRAKQRRYTGPSYNAHGREIV